MINRISSLIAKYATYLFIILFSISNILFTYTKNNINKFNININVFTLIFVFLLIILLVKYINKINEKILLYILIFITLLFGCYWVITNNSDIIQIDDSYNVFETAKSFINKDYAGIGYKSYINTYPHNLFLMIYYSLFIIIFNDNALLFIRLANVIYSILMIIYIYKISDILFNNKNINKVTLILLMFMNQYMLLTFHTYSYLLSYILVIVSIYYFIKYLNVDNKIDLLISLIIIIISSLIKNNSLIVLVGMSIYLIIRSINTRKLIPIIGILLSVIVYVSLNMFVSSYFESKGQTSYDNKLPMISWIAYGLNYDDNNIGGYFPYIEDYHVQNDYVVEYTDIFVKENIKHSINYVYNNLYSFSEFYSKKFIRTYSDPTFDALDSYSILDQSNSLLYGNLSLIIKMVWKIGLLLMVLGLISFINKINDINIYFIGIIVFGGFLFHTVWETKSIYVYNYIILLIPYASYGINKIINKRMKGDYIY